MKVLQSNTCECKLQCYHQVKIIKLISILDHVNYSLETLVARSVHLARVYFIKCLLW